MRVLHPEARRLLADAGCLVDDQHVCRIDPQVVADATATAPRRIELRGATPQTSHVMGEGRILFTPAGGIPHAADLDRGKRPGNLADWRTHTILSEHFDVLHLLSTGPEPQDVDPPLRHLATTAGSLRLSTKLPVIYARGAAQVADGFEMTRLARGLDEYGFRRASHTYTVVNVNSPLQIDQSMIQGLFDFGRHNQMVVITPFTLSGAMAPITLAGALVQQHAEFLGALTIAQLANPGAPIVYGGFTSNVDMRTGAPAFGTPESVRGTIATGQLARLVGLPWRTSGSSTSNLVDAQSAYEHAMSMWAAVVAGADLVIHAAGWVEGGLTVSFEKTIIDVEVLQQLAEAMLPVPFGDDELAFDAIAGVPHGGHFFGQSHTMERYETAFYDPLVTSWANFGQWQEDGAPDAAIRANRLWKQVVEAARPAVLPEANEAALTEFVERRTREGGAPPEN